MNQEKKTIAVEGDDKNRLTLVVEICVKRKRTCTR
jgi:hypothetical protein